MRLTLLARKRARISHDLGRFAFGSRTLCFIATFRDFRDFGCAPDQLVTLNDVAAGLGGAPNGDGPYVGSKQSSHQAKPNNKNLTSTGFKQQRICTPLAPTRNKIIYKTACSDGPNSGSGKPSQNRLRSKGPPWWV